MEQLFTSFAKLKMIFLKLSLILTFSLCQVHSDSSKLLEQFISNPSKAALLKNAVTRRYSTNKLEIICKIITLMQNNLENVTLVGTQNIYETNKDIIELRTIELHWPKASKTRKTVELADSDDVSISDIRKWFNIASVIGFESSVGGEDFSKEGELTSQAYLSKDFMYAFLDKTQLINKTIEANSIEDVEMEIAKLKNNHPLVSVHKFNEDGQFLKGGSHIVPEFVAQITSAEGETNQELIDNILKSAATAFIEVGRDHDLAPTKLAEYLKKEYPKVDFYVFPNEPSAWHLTYKGFFRVSVQFDLDSWFNEEDIIYTVFGVKDI